MISTQIEAACQILSKNGLVGIPTETVYGLAANAMSELAVSKIFELKKRPSYNPLIVHISHIDDLEKYTQNIPEKAYQLAKDFLAGTTHLGIRKKTCGP